MLEFVEDSMMHRRFAKMIIMGLITGILGVVLSLVPIVSEVEEDLGLHLLFKLRGPREVPVEVLIVSMDTESAQNLSLLSKPERWPRSLHASLVENLVKEGAKVTAFDIFFEEPRSPDEDEPLARTMKEAQRVVLCQSLRQDSVQMTDGHGARVGFVNVERLVPPLDLFAQSAVASAPFPLPKVPVKVSKYWTFKTEAGDTPTLPVVAFQVFALDIYEDFTRLLSKFAESDVKGLPSDKESAVSLGNVERLVLNLRDIFRKHAGIGEKMLQELTASGSAAMSPQKIHVLKALIRMYSSPESALLNFYGPPGSVPTVPYHRVLQGQAYGETTVHHLDFSGKAVFVGLSQLLRPEQRDGFYTVFSQPNGIDMSGVEIAATAFGNLLDETHVQPLTASKRTVLLLGWAILLSILSQVLPTSAAALVLIFVSCGYLAWTHHEFTNSSIWYPLVIPLLVQAPFAFFGTLWWKYRDTHRERENIRQAFGYYLPDKVVDEISRGMGGPLASTQVVHGTCLSTDGEQYVRLSEFMNPGELSKYMNRYYEAVFRPVRDRGGTISDVVGDSMMAIWATSQPDTVQRVHACAAALGIAEAVRRFNESTPSQRLPTRIGMHSGHLSLGNIGGIDHYEYRAVGDVVNTAARIEGLNKLLGTTILVSGDVIEEVEGFLTRELGRFVLAGKSRPVVIHELMCRVEESTEEQRLLCATFAEALREYAAQSWDAAVKLFEEVLKIRAKDGPSLFYLGMCEAGKENPPEEAWDGLIYLSKK